jgi:hypothetical protein
VRERVEYAGVRRGGRRRRGGTGQLERGGLGDEVGGESARRAADAGGQEEAVASTVSAGGSEGRSVEGWETVALPRPSARRLVTSLVGAATIVDRDARCGVVERRRGGRARRVTAGGGEEGWDALLTAVLTGGRVVWSGANRGRCVHGLRKGFDGEGRVWAAVAVRLDGRALESVASAESRVAVVV